MEDIVKVNLGCGPNAVRGWVNIDKSWRVILSRFPILKMPLRPLCWLGLLTRESLEIDIPKDLQAKRHDVTRGLPFGDSSVDYVFTSHMIEHLTREQAMFVMKECHRVLKRGGVMRVVAPDLEKLIDDYMHGKEARDPSAADKLMAGMGLEGIGDRLPLVNRVLGKHHQWAYDFESLAHRLYDIGFREVTRCERGKGEVPDLEELGELRLHPDSLHLEAKR